MEGVAVPSTTISVVAFSGRAPLRGTHPRRMRQKKRRAIHTIHALTRAFDSKRRSARSSKGGFTQAAVLGLSSLVLP